MSFWPTDDQEPFQEEDQEEDEENIEEQIVCFKAEYAFQMSKNSQLQSELEQVNVRIRRRQAILEYYDDYIFNYVFDNNITNFNIKELANSIDIIDIDKDYRNVISTIKYEETHRLETEEEDENISYTKIKTKFHHQSSMTVSFNSNSVHSAINSKMFTNINNQSSKMHNRNNGMTRMRSKSAAHVMHANILYQVSKEDQIIEKNWMKELRKKKFKIFINKHRKQQLNKIKKEYEQKLQELEQQINIKNRMKQLNEVRNKLEILKKSRIQFIKNTSKELDQLRNVIHNL